VKTPVCPYCNQAAVKATGQDIYPHRPDLHHKKFWLCAPCGAYAGDVQHPDYANRPVQLANRELRTAKMHAHQTFDYLWQQKLMSRTQAYEWLAAVMQLAPAVCHIGMFDLNQCKAVVDHVNQLRSMRQRPEKTEAELLKAVDRF